MSVEDDGITARGLWGIAWVLAVIAGIAWVTAATLMDEPHPITRELGLWLAVAAVTTVFSAACAVLCGVKGAAERLSARTAEHDRS
jgi:hypothetical protein